MVFSSQPRGARLDRHALCKAKYVAVTCDKLGIIAPNIYDTVRWEE